MCDTWELKKNNDQTFALHMEISETCFLHSGQPVFVPVSN